MQVGVVYTEPLVVFFLFDKSKDRQIHLITNIDHPSVWSVDFLVMCFSCKL